MLHSGSRVDKPFTRQLMVSVPKLFLSLVGLSALRQAALQGQCKLSGSQCVAAALTTDANLSPNSQACVLRQKPARTHHCNCDSLQWFLQVLSQIHQHSVIQLAIMADLEENWHELA